MYGIMCVLFKCVHELQKLIAKSYLITLLLTIIFNKIKMYSFMKIYLLLLILNILSAKNPNVFQTMRVT